MNPSTARFSGVLTPVVTPFNDDLSANANRLIEQCRWLLSQDVGLAVFGTNSEANSLSVGEKMDLLDQLVPAIAGDGGEGSSGFGVLGLRLHFRRHPTPSGSRRGR